MHAERISLSCVLLGRVEVYMSEVNGASIIPVNSSADKRSDNTVGRFVESMEASRVALQQHSQAPHGAGQINLYCESLKLFRSWLGITMKV